MPRDGGIDEQFAAYVRERGEHHPRVAVLLTGDWHAAEDLAQASLVKLYRVRPRRPTRHDPRSVTAGEGGSAERHRRGSAPAVRLGEPAVRQRDVDSPGPVMPAAGRG
ncbi:MAG TPA: hypothetical protein VK280_15415 [Streptosporangiaceae bacterium]|nr:hypothetical protein [Streptosporangiaceae bacterium]